VTLAAGEPAVAGELVHARRFAADPALVTPVVAGIVELLVAGRLIEKDEQNRVGVCVEEGLRNAVVHGNHADSSKSVGIQILAGADSFSVMVEDDGEGFSLADVPDPASGDAVWGERGRGIRMMALYADRVAYFRNGRTLVLTFRFRRSGGGGPPR
jgi:anti-sigma regulatory factor (Ser/Thr protein kinase)